MSTQVESFNENDHQSSYSSESTNNNPQSNNNNMNGANNNGSSTTNNNINNNESIKTETNDSATGSSSTENNNNNNPDDVCRDFLRNVCRRGKNCRYKHPDGSDPELLKNKEQFVFCHDFQNRECRRDNCRFLHCSKHEEEIFRSTGRLPPHLQAQMQNDDRLSAPVCKDFMHGTCRRGARCKYRHQDYQPSTNRNGPPPSIPSYDGRNGGRIGGQVGNYPMSNSSHNQMDYPSPSYGSRGSQMMSSSNYGGYNDNYPDTPPNKRKRYDPGSMYCENNSAYPGAYNDPPPPPPPPPPQAPSMRGGGGGGGAAPAGAGYGISSPSQTYYAAAPRNQPMESRTYLEEENAALRRRIDDLKKQLSEYMSTNEYLMEQLNQYRASNSAAAVATSLQQQQPPPGSVSSTGAVQMSAPITLQTTQVTPQATAVAIGPLPPVSIVSSIASISLPTVSAPVTLVNSSASLASFTPSMHSTNPWPMGVDQ